MSNQESRQYHGADGEDTQAAAHASVRRRAFELRDAHGEDVTVFDSDGRSLHTFSAKDGAKAPIEVPAPAPTADERHGARQKARKGRANRGKAAA